MAETVTLTIPVYRTPDGRHTCSADVAGGRFCPMLTQGMRGFACSWPNGPRSIIESRNWIDDHEDGYAIPVDGCPVAAAMDRLGRAAPVVSSPHD